MDINKLSISRLLEFKKMTERSRVTFINKLQKPKEDKPPKKGGGNYWVRCISGLNNAFEYKDNNEITKKIEEVQPLRELTNRNQTRIMYDLNLQVLYNFEDYDFSILHPYSELKFPKRKNKSILIVNNLPIQIIPGHIFTFQVDNKVKIGGIWFLKLLDEYRLEELGLFCESIYRYLSYHYSSEYEIDPYQCLAIDATNQNVVRYNQIMNGDISSIFDATVETVAKYLK